MLWYSLNGGNARMAMNGRVLHLITCMILLGLLGLVTRGAKRYAEQLHSLSLRRVYLYS